MDIIARTDKTVAKIIKGELSRQEDRLQMIASENYASRAVMAAQGSIMTNKYAEGYPRARYYEGCRFYDEIEQLAIDRAKKIFKADHANVQPHAGAQANAAVFFGMLKAGETVLGMDLAAGGHLSHGQKFNFSGRYFNAVAYGVHPDTHRIDMEAVRRLAEQHRPRLIIAGASAYPRTLDFPAFAAIARSVEALLLVDMAHIAGLVAAGVHPSPFPHADLVTTTTHKTLRGPRGGLILCRSELAKKIDSAVFPGLQGGPLMHAIAAKAVAFQEALQPSFKAYQRQVVRNCAVLARSLMDKGYTLVSGGTDNHLLLVDLRKQGVTGAEAATALDTAGITVNKNRIPFDPLGPVVTSGIRVGTPAITTRGMKDKEIRQIAGWMDEVIRRKSDAKFLRAVAREVGRLCRRFPVYR